MLPKQKIYVASSWRCARQRDVVLALRKQGHEVYDFKNPVEGEHGFSWVEIDQNYKTWNVPQYIDALNHPISVHGFNRDHEAMEWATMFILVLPCGRSAHLELGWACGKGKLTGA